MNDELNEGFYSYSDLFEHNNRNYFRPFSRDVEYNGVVIFQKVTYIQVNSNYGEGLTLDIYGINLILLASISVSNNESVNYFENGSLNLIVQ